MNKKQHKSPVHLLRLAQRSCGVAASSGAGKRDHVVRTKTPSDLQSGSVTRCELSRPMIECHTPDESNFSSAADAPSTAPMTCVSARSLSLDWLMRNTH